MNINQGLFCFVLLTLCMLSQARPQMESVLQSSEKPEPVSINLSIFLRF